MVTTISVEPATKSRFDADKGLHASQQKRQIGADEFINYLLEGFETGNKVVENLKATGQLDQLEGVQ